MATNNQISVRAGATLTLTCLKKDSAGAEEDVTPITVSANLTEIASGKIIIGLTVTKTGGGHFTLSLTAAQTLATGPSGFLCTIKYVYASGVVDIVDAFPVEIKP